jgi:hypothetical protein
MRTLIMTGVFLIAFNGTTYHKQAWLTACKQTNTEAYCLAVLNKICNAKKENTLCVD